MHNLNVQIQEQLIAFGIIKINTLTTYVTADISFALVGII